MWPSPDERSTPKGSQNARRELAPPVASVQPAWERASILDRNQDRLDNAAGDHDADRQLELTEAEAVIGARGDRALGQLHRLRRGRDVDREAASEQRPAAGAVGLEAGGLQ